MKRVMIQFPEEDLKRVDTAARRHGLSRSAYIRSLVTLSIAAEMARQSRPTAWAADYRNRPAGTTFVGPVIPEPREPGPDDSPNIPAAALTLSVPFTAGAEPEGTP